MSDNQESLLNDKKNKTTYPKNFSNRVEKVIDSLKLPEGTNKELINAIDAMEKKTISSHEFSEYEDRYQIFAIISLIFFIASTMFPTKKMKDDIWRGRIV